MKLGIYTDIGAQTCGRCVGSAGHVKQDMDLFASWGADLIEVDACGGAVDEATWAEYVLTRNVWVLLPVIFDSSESETSRSRYRDAINATGRPMVHSVCAEGMADVWTWGMGVGNMWRVCVICASVSTPIRVARRGWRGSFLSDTLELACKFTGPTRHRG